MGNCSSSSITIIACAVIRDRPMRLGEQAGVAVRFNVGPVQSVGAGLESGQAR
ncbi:hypothetical protein QJS10_CPA08g00658 [Acorus calamus]|uniref:Uncharacterized protein n=1 Tax=Acorus calamus TaxID=4465 RepID=A0AAV9EC11_ACOCL|nr:hypothetical protein QJS10_CPA08g00658 [Acorus calamus]